MKSACLSRRSLLGAAISASASTPFTAGADGDQPGSGVHYFDPAFQARMTDLGSIWAQKRTPIESAAGVIDSCEQFVARAAFVETADRRAADYQICFAVTALRHARPPNQPSACYKEAGSCKAAEILVHRLDFASFPSSLGPRVGTGPSSGLLGKLDLPVSISSRTSFAVDIPDWLYRMDALAAAAFGPSGNEQWLVRLVDRSKLGTYFAAGYLLVEGFDSPKLSASWLGASQQGAPMVHNPGDKPGEQPLNSTHA